MLIDHYSSGRSLVVSLHDTRLDAAAAVAFKDRLYELVDAGNTHIVLEMSKVEFIDSSGLGALVAVLKHASRDGSLAVTGLQKAAEQIFKLTRMDTVFTIFPSVDDALEAA